jgi:N-acetylmuramoyl-L-alanine amidase
MNTYAVGIEIANNGIGERYPQAQVDAAFAASTTLVARLGLDPGDVCEHYDYAPTRKIDPATAAAIDGPWQPRSATSSGTWLLADLIVEHQRRCHAGDVTPEDDEMTPEQAAQLAELHAAMCTPQPGFPDPSGTGKNLTAAWAALWGQAQISNDVLARLDVLRQNLVDSYPGGIPDPNGKPGLNLPWAALYGEQLTANSVLPTLDGIVRRLEAIEAKLP